MVVIGNLRQRLTIQRKVAAGSSDDGYSDVLVAWEDWKTSVPCSLYVRRGQERFQEIGEGGQRYSSDTYQFTVRYNSVVGIDATMRILHGGNTFDIRSIRPDAQTRREMVIECEVQDAVIDGAEDDPDESPPTIPDDPDESPPSIYAFTLTAGSNASWIGYLSGTIGSIDAQPVSDAAITSTVMSRHVAGEGGVEISGAALEAILSGKNVYVDGAAIPGLWTFSSTQAVWWTISGFPTLVSGEDYEIEIK